MCDLHTILIPPAKFIEIYVDSEDRTNHLGHIQTGRITRLMIPPFSSWYNAVARYEIRNTKYTRTELCLKFAGESSVAGMYARSRAGLGCTRPRTRRWRR